MSPVPPLPRHQLPENTAGMPYLQPHSTHGPLPAFQGKKPQGEHSVDVEELHTTTQQPLHHEDKGQEAGYPAGRQRCRELSRRGPAPALLISTPDASTFLASPRGNLA